MSSPRTLQARARLQASRQALQRQLHPAGPASPSLAGLIGSHPWALVGAGIAAGAVLGAVLLMRRAPLRRPAVAPLLAQVALGMAWRALMRPKLREHPD